MVTSINLFTMHYERESGFTTVNLGLRRNPGFASVNLGLRTSLGLRSKPRSAVVDLGFTTLNVQHVAWT